MAEKYMLDGREYKLQCSWKPKKDGRYSAALIYEQGGVRAQKTITSKYKEKIESRLPAIGATLFNSVANEIRSRDVNATFSGSFQMMEFPMFLYLYWEDVASLKGWKISTKKHKEKTLRNYLLYLSQKPLASFTLEDFIKAAVMAVTGKETMEGSTVSEKKKYREIFNVLVPVLDAACMRGYFHSNPVKKYYELLKTPKDHMASIRAESRKNELDILAEIKLYERIVAGMYKEGMLFGVALMLFEGLKAEEVCALRFKDVTSLYSMRTNMKALNISKRRDSDAKNDQYMDEPIMIRRIPMHRQLEDLYKIWLEISRERLDKTTRNDLQEVYLVRKGMQIKGGVKPRELKAFAKKLFEELGISTYNEITSADGSETSVNTPPDRLMRYNFEHHLKINGCTIDERNNLLGRAMTTTDGRHYRDWASDWCLRNLKSKIDRWSIGSGTVEKEGFVNKTTPIIEDTGNRLAKASADVIAEKEGDYTIIITSKKGVNVEMTLVRKEQTDD